MAKIKETALYAPVKAYLVGLGYEVKGEVGAADVVARRGAEAPLIVELKTGFSLQLMHQAVARQRISDSVYVAVPRWKGRAGWKAFKANVGLCKRLGLGVLSVDLEAGTAQAHSDPAPFQPRKSKLKAAALMREFDAREGDPNEGGMTRMTIVTAYRQEAEKCARHLAEYGPSRGRDVKEATGVERATTMMRANHYGWFEKQSAGVYALSAAGQAALNL
ncbi:DUF2161 domain-containing phosphodiesterase [Lentibacter sp.]|jgi:hypothetical protein|uniref:DUF2161 domain-containing phosphodiesterase n=1 Tax=Lentibacter sp. TaxID=2024994 RepID=UPI003F6953A8